ncbi:MAG TPA: hypothetical protein VKL40_08535 [Candidatus Angelobacter sp.]|nr:hypothetical protein [Candidatus Angelobacter sp.]
MKNVLSVLGLFALLSAAAAAQGGANPRSAGQIAELISLREKVASADTRTRVEATHRVWTVGLATSDPEIKLTALQLLAQPVGSSSDHIRMPAMYAMAEIAGSTTDNRVKTKALELLSEPLRAGQVPVRDVAVDVVNDIVNASDRNAIAPAAVRALGEPVRSGNNGVRIPAIYALVNAVRGSHNEAAYLAALDALAAPLESNAMIGGMEVRMMAAVAVERIGVESSETAAKARAMGILQSYAGKGGWEPEAKRRAEEAVAAIQNSMKKS